ncbi:TolC family protein [Flavobacterium selenitireducens]|uniref:TolC family protein n=1 Tax=Flavobacterium selenitireducens TaxID=2722704 RepID=UPI00168A8FBA|nr:TolC family protein [Flavobacterium selenitireducens]MBD3582397.1 TolC family protein [Flavobacterium selenitireducens]
MRKINLIVALLLVSVSVSFAQQGKKWTLKECVEYALKNNIQIKQSELDLQLSAIDKKDAIGAFLPSLNANANHSWNIGLNQNITTGLLENQTTQFTSAGINAGIDIYKGLQNQNQLRRSKLSIIASQYRLDKMRDDISLNVANAFLQILFNKENLKVQKQQLANNERLMTRTQEMVNAGSVPRGDLADMRATVATSQKAVVDAENLLMISKLSLAQLLQLDDFKDFDVADNDYEVSESPVMLQTPEAIFDKAKEARNEIKIARTNLLVAERDVKISQGALQPNLQGYYSFSTRAAYTDRVIGGIQDPDNPTSVIGTVEGTGQNVVQQNFIPVLGKYEPIFDQFSENKGHNFGLQLSIPILNGFAARNNVERSKVALERSKIAFSQAELDLERNVYQAFVDAKNALQAYEAALVAVEARELAFNYAQERYNVGMMNSFDLNQAQTLYVNSQSDAVRAKFDYIFRVKVVEFYFGIPINITE